MTNLEHLDFDRDCFDLCDFLPRLPRLTSLCALEFNPGLRDMNAIAACAGLRQLFLSPPKWGDIDITKLPTGLESLGLDRAIFEDEQSLWASLTRLTRLELLET
eukprot:TRINITY_DN20303_c0_g1_i1.p2 TRINITY_DN20303_c0_g1~~TRINITY_DN20303_c0_g1_i1.p2  ORF type:complete len:104 (+),score=19.05 TRINITY_DN20303_c0_g1_i1:197-508(+)